MATTCGLGLRGLLEGAGTLLLLVLDAGVLAAPDTSSLRSRLLGDDGVATAFFGMAALRLLLPVGFLRGAFAFGVVVLDELAADAGAPPAGLLSPRNAA